MKTRFLAILAFLLIALLLTACPPTPITQTPQFFQVTQIKENFSTPQDSAALEQEINYSLVPPGTIFFKNEDGTLATALIEPELSQPEWDAQDFPKGFSTTLTSGHWKKFLLGPANVDQGYLVDVTPQEASTEGAEIVSQVMPENDGESWLDVLWLFQPKEAPPLPVYVKVYTTEGWLVAYHEKLNLEPGTWQEDNIGPASEQRGFVAAVSPLGNGGFGDTLQRVMLNPEYHGDWQDMLRIQIPQSQNRMQADVAIYQAPSKLLKAEITPRLQPGELYTGILGLSEEQAAYVMEVSPLSETDNQVESYGVEPVFMDGAWRDVLRIKIPADRSPMDVNLRVYALKPGSRLGNVEEIPTITPDLLATEWAAYLQKTSTPTKPVILPSVTPKPLPTATRLASCPGALPSRLQIGQPGIVSQDPLVANRVRRAPNRDAEILGQIMPGEKFTVLEGPICADGWAWWRVRSQVQDLEGWTSEGDAGYWLVPLYPEAAAVGEGQNAITLTADQLDSADDIEAAIKRATAEGTRPGSVILDGRNGDFVFTGADRSLNIFVSNLTLLGVNKAVIKNCGDGLFFDNFPLKNILVEGIEFNCEGGGVVASGSFENVTLQNNIFRAGRTGIGIGGTSSDWLITENVVEAGGEGINMAAAKEIVVTNNQISGNIGITLQQCSQFQVQNNVIQAAYQGILLTQESWKNLVQANTIQGVSHSGITLGSDVTGNQILENKVSCAPGTSCVMVEATPEVAKMNTITPLSEEAIVYSNDFESSAGQEWSHHHIEISPTGKKFLGQFGNDAVSLQLTDLADHTQIRVVFELYIIRSWDGNINPDIWQFKVAGQSLLLTTFDNQDFYLDHSQAYPDDYMEGSHPPRTGAKENNTLGYQFADRQMDAVYLLSFTVPNATPTLNLTFVAKGLMADLADESWGIDNITVYTIK